MIEYCTSQTRRNHCQTTQTWTPYSQIQNLYPNQRRDTVGESKKHVTTVANKDPESETFQNVLKSEKDGEKIYDKSEEKGHVILP